jgi:large subunit ribosomal protein L19
MDVAALVNIKKNKKIPDIAPGDTVRVSARIVEGGKERIQVFQGVVLAIKRGGNGASFTVRHVAFGIGVERTFPFNSPLVEKVEIVRQGKVRRSRLYYLRGLSGKAARRKIKRVERKARQVGEELIEAEPEEELAPEDVLMEEPEEAAEEAAEAKAEEAAEVKAEEPAEAKAEEAVAEKAEEPTEVKAEEAPEAKVEEPAEAEVAEPEAPVEEEPVAEETAEPKPEVAEEPVAEAEEKPAEAAAPEEPEATAPEEAPEAEAKPEETAEEPPAEEENSESA